MNSIRIELIREESRKNPTWFYLVKDWHGYNTYRIGSFAIRLFQTHEHYCAIIRNGVVLAVKR